MPSLLVDDTQNEVVKTKSEGLGNNGLILLTHLLFPSQLIFVAANISHQKLIPTDSEFPDSGVSSGAGCHVERNSTHAQASALSATL